MGPVSRQVHLSALEYNEVDRFIGAGLVGAYVYANGKDPIISGAIAQSGAAPSGGMPGSSDRNNFSELAKMVNCGGLNAEEELLCMQKVPALRLQDIVSTTSSSPLGGNNGSQISVPRFGAGVDNVTVFSNLTERLEKNLAAKVVRAPRAYT